MKKRRASYTNFSVLVFSIGLMIGLCATVVVLDKGSITGLLIGIMGSPADCTEGDDYSGTGDWIINQSTYCRDMIITLGQNASIYIHNKTVWQNVTIQLNPNGYLNKTGNRRNISSRANITMLDASGSLYMNATDGDGCKIETIGGYNTEIFLGSTAVIEDTEFNDLGWDRSGSGLDFGANGVSVTANDARFIDCIFTDTDGALIVGYSNNTVIQGCNFTGIKRYGVRLTGTNISFIDNDYYDNLVSFGGVFYGMNDSNISSNRFINNHGGFLEYLQYSTFSNNIVSGNDYGGVPEVAFFTLGFENYVAEGNVMESNSITCRNDSSIGFITAQYDPMNETDIGSGNYYESNNSVFRNNNISGCYIGMYVTGDYNGPYASTGHVFDGNRFTDDNYGIYLRWVTDSIISHTVFTNVGTAVVLNATGNIHITDVNSAGLTGSDAILIQGDDALEASGLYSNTYALNTTVENITLTYGNLFRMWYLDVNASNSAGGSITGANVSVYDLDNKYVVSALTPMTVSFNITEYNQTLTGMYYLGNYTINATKAGYPKASKSFNLTGNTHLSISFGNTINSNSLSTSEWKMYGRTLDNTRYYPASVNAAYMKQIWNFSTGDMVLAVPAIADGIVYFGSYDNNFYALNASTGVHIWNYTTSGGIYSSAALAGGMVFFGSMDDNFYCLNATNGMQIWNYTTSHDIFSSPSVADGIVFFDNNRSIFALDAFNGEKVWNYTSSVYTNNLAFTVSDNLVYIAGESIPNPVTALNMSNGAVVWRNTYYNNSRRYSAHVGNNIYFPMSNNNAYVLALDSRNGSFIWASANTTDQQMGGISISNGRVFVGTLYNSRETCWSFDALSGATLWSYIDLGRISEVWGTPLSTDDAVFFDGYSSPDPSGGYLALRVSDGSLLWYYNSSDAQGSTGSSSMADGILYSGNRDGKVYAFKSFPPSTSTSGGGGGGRDTAGNNQPPIQCHEGWTCSEWSSCSSSGTQTRTCSPSGRCQQHYDNMPKDIIMDPKPAASQACSYTPTCSDGIADQGETDVDCGGPCSPCIASTESPKNVTAPVEISKEKPSAVNASSLWPYLIIAAAVLVLILLSLYLFKKSSSDSRSRWKIRTKL